MVTVQLTEQEVQVLTDLLTAAREARTFDEEPYGDLDALLTKLNEA